MNHEEFVEKYQQGLLKVHVNESAALKIANSRVLPKRYQAAHIFWCWIWLLTIPAGIYLIIWVNLWAGIGVLILGPIIKKAVKRSASEFILDYALENERFYNAVVESKTLRIENVPSDPAEAYYKLGMDFCNKGQYDYAISNFTIALEMNPKHLEAYYNRGLAYDKKGLCEQAIMDYNKVLEINPKDAIAYASRAISYYRKGEHDKAITDYNKAQSLGKIPSELLEVLHQALKK